MLLVPRIAPYLVATRHPARASSSFTLFISSLSQTCSLSNLLTRLYTILPARGDTRHATTSSPAADPRYNRYPPAVLLLLLIAQCQQRQQCCSSHSAPSAEGDRHPLCCFLAVRLTLLSLPLFRWPLARRVKRERSASSSRLSRTPLFIVFWHKRGRRSRVQQSRRAQ